jgi:Planctomycete cytochrome C/WD domain, G-beta repeat
MIRRRHILLLSSLCSLCLCGESFAKITYDDNVLPLLKEKCVGCHNQDKKRGGVVLNNFTKVMEGGSSGVIVKPGDPDNSPLFQSMAHKREPFMPPSSPVLPDETVALVRQWIADGALENSGSKAIAAGPKVNVGLPGVVRGKPAGAPPMPAKALSLEPIIHTARADAVTALACSPWAPLCAVGGQKEVLLYNTDTLDLIGVLPFPEGEARVLKFSRNGGLLLAGGGHAGKSGKVVLWNVTTGERIIEVGDENDSVLAADVSPDQTQVALGGPSKVVRVYGTKDGKLIYEIRKHTEWITALEYSPDGVLLTSGDRVGGLFVWEAFTGREYFSLRGHTAGVTEVSWRSDGNVCASASEDGTIHLWEMENGNSIKSWGAHGGGVESVRYARDGRIVTAGRDKLVKLWDGGGNAQRTFEARPDVALCAAFTHDDARVIAGDWTGQIPVWTAADGKAVGQLTPNPPTLAERLDGAQKELAAKQAARDQTAAVAAASMAASQKAASDLAAAQKVAAEAAANVKATADAVTNAKTASDKATVTATTAESISRAKTVLAQAFAEASSKVKAASDQAPGDAALAIAVSRAEELSAPVVAELGQAQKKATEMTAAAQSATAALTKAQQAAASAVAVAATAPKQVEALTAAAKSAAAKAAADQATAAAAAQAFTQATAALEKWKAALAAAKSPAQASK